jgi:hypothetical protein
VRVSDEESVVEGVYVRPGVSGLGLSVKGIGENSICTVRVPDEESVVEGGYVRPGVSGLGLSVKGIGESGNPHVGHRTYKIDSICVGKRVNEQEHIPCPNNASRVVWPTFPSPLLAALQPPGIVVFVNEPI